MKKGMFAIALSTITILCFVSCNKNTVQEKHAINSVRFDFEEVYSDVIKSCYEIISNYENTTDIGDGMSGIYEAAKAIGEEALNTIGYVFKDINNDGKEELLIGVFEKSDFAFEKNELYAVYAYDGKKPVLIFEGNSRNFYSLTDSGTVFYHGSSSAIHYMFGEYELEEDGEFICRDFYFTHEKDEEEIDLGFFHNKTGECDPNTSEELEINFDEFEAMQKDIAKNTIKLQDIKFAKLKNFV